MAALTDRDTNAQPITQPANEEKSGEENTTQQRNEALEQKIAENNGKPGQAYISPSDAIQSPASQKLAGFKQRQIDRQGAKKPAARTLFSRTASSCSNGFDDIDAGNGKQ